MAEDDALVTPHKDEEEEGGEERKLKRSASSDDAKDSQRTISHLCHRFSNFDVADLNSVDAVEDLLGIAEDDIQIWDSDDAMIWDCEPGEAFRYLRAVDELRKLTGSFETFRLTDDIQLQNGILCRAHAVLQMAMTKLEDEFIHLLVQYRHVSLSNSDHHQHHATSFRSDGLGEEYYSRRSSSSGEDSKFHREVENHSDGSAMIDLIVPTDHPNIRCIAQIMFDSNYDGECCQAYVGVRRDALDECLTFLLGDRLSIEQILRMDWDTLHSKIDRWKKAIKIFVNVYLVREKHLCHHIFEELSDEIAARCFFESSKTSIFQLLNFGEAVAVVPATPEKLFGILDMYDVLGELLPHIESLFQNMPDSSSCILSESHEVRHRLGESAKSAIDCFKAAVKNGKSTTAFPGGGIHHLTRYVMNFVSTMSAYTETLEILLHVVDNSTHTIQEEEDEDQEKSSSSHRISSALLRSIIAMLESNLEDKASLYQDPSLQNIFKMNNIYYMVKKVSGSDLWSILGDEWIRSHRREYGRHASGYERISWYPILSLLRDEGITRNSEGKGISSSSSRHHHHHHHQRLPKTILKERFKRFNAAFEEIYKTHTAWMIPDSALRVEMQIKISQNLLHAYRTLMGRYGVVLDGVRHPEKYLKYSPDDLEKYTSDLFTGSSKTLISIRR